MTDWYQILGIPRQATEEEIKKAYRKLAKNYHPDTHPGNREYEQRFREISEAYSILSDAEKRKKYDEELHPIPNEQDRVKRGEKGKVPKAETVDFENLHRNFERFFGFNPKTQEIVHEDKLKTGEHNPLDASILFEQFMGIKR